MTTSSTLVPLEVWHYNSPALKRAGRHIDIGLFAEALVFYDRVYIAFQNEEQFARLVAWFVGQGQLQTLISLINEGAVVPYYYAFMTIAGEKDGIWDILNMQDEEQSRSPVFAKRILQSQRVQGLVRKASLRESLITAAESHHVEVKAEEFGSAIQDAKHDYASEGGTSFLLQILVDSLYREMGMLAPPIVRTSIVETGNLKHVNWGLNFDELSRHLGPNLAMHVAIPLAGAAFGTRTIWSAAQLGSDLFLGAPLTSYAQQKLGEGSNAAKVGVIRQELITKVAFPNIRALVNKNQLGVEAVLDLRKHSARFRQWLQSERELQRDPVRAYLGELAEEAGYRKGLGTVVGAAGLFGGATVGAVAAGPLGAVAGGLAGAVTQYVMDLASKMVAGWKPVVFGNWATARIEKAVRDDES